MTVTYGLVSWTYLLLFIGGSHCLVDIQQSTSIRQKHRLLCMLTIAQRATHSDNLGQEKALLSHQQTICTMASHHRRRSSLERASIESILKSGEPGQPAAPPSSHVGNSPNRAYFAMAPPPRTNINHSRALSYNPRRPNRLSLSFPVAPSTNSNESSRPTPTSSNIPSFPPTPAGVIPENVPNDASSFLVALAAQERRVLELKEELGKAEMELKTLKRQWASHESHKKKAEIRHVEPLQPLQTVVSGGSGEETITTRQSTELDRRRAALLGNLTIPKENRRKFSGAHTRTLSLLSPERSNFREPRPFPAVDESRSETPSLSRTATLPTMRTMPDTSQGITRISQATNRARHSYQSGMTQGAKQIAEDVKAGLWTFLDDLRQATVGDEAVHGTTNRASLDPNVSTPVRRGSKASQPGAERVKRNPSPKTLSPRTWDSLTGNSSLMDAAGALWPELDQPLEPSTSKANTKKASKTISLAPALDDLDDDWSNWDSPTPKSPRWSASTTLSDPATPSNGNVDENVTYVTKSTFQPSTPPKSRNNIDKSTNRIQSNDEPSTPSKRDSIQWPALDKLTAQNLRGGLQRTISTIMTEWEKSITPPPEREETSDPLGSASEEAHIQDQVILMSR